MLCQCNLTLMNANPIPKKAMQSAECLWWLAAVLLYRPQSAFPAIGNLNFTRHYQTVSHKARSYKAFNANV